MAKEKDKFVRFPGAEFEDVQKLIDEVNGETTRRIYDYQVIVDAARFYRKYRKVFEGK